MRTVRNCVAIAMLVLFGVNTNARTANTAMTVAGGPIDSPKSGIVPLESAREPADVDRSAPTEGLQQTTTSPTISHIRYCKEVTGLVFEVEVTGLLPGTAILGIGADHPAFTSPTERIRVDFDGKTGEVTFGPLVETLGTPSFDRWEDGTIEHFELESLGPGHWRLGGEICHGTDPFLFSDTVRQTVIRTMGNPDIFVENTATGIDCPVEEFLLCSDSTYCTVEFTRTYSGNYRPGEPYDYVTISPDGQGETFADTGIRLTLVVKSCAGGVPIACVPAQEIVLFNSALAFCAPATFDAPTDSNGVSTFSGTIAGGGCAPSLDVFVAGVFVCTIPVKINSPDTGLTSPGFVDASDLAAFAEVLGVPEEWDICFDYNESGPPTIDASDLAFFASKLGTGCD